MLAWGQYLWGWCARVCWAVVVRGVVGARAGGWVVVVSVDVVYTRGGAVTEVVDGLSCCATCML